MVEFKLYYDDNGRVICYTCDEHVGNYIIVDPMTFARCRHDLLVIDGEIVYPTNKVILSKLTVSDSGTSCHSDDVCIITDVGPTTTWKLETNEYN